MKVILAYANLSNIDILANEGEMFLGQSTVLVQTTISQQLINGWQMDFVQASWSPEDEAYWSVIPRLYFLAPQTERLLDPDI